MPALVLDASVALAWVLPDEAGLEPTAERAAALLEGDEALVPQIWGLEVSNALLAATRRGRVGEGAMEEAIRLLRQLPVRADRWTARHSLKATTLLARTHGLTTYDASYLELAMREALPLATLDGRLREVAQRVGVLLV